MPWLADLVESSEGSFNVLPVQCLCEFLLNSTSMGANEESSASTASNLSVTESENQKMKKKKQKLLLLHLQNLLQHPMNDEQQQQGK